MSYSLITHAAGFDQDSATTASVDTTGSDLLVLSLSWYTGTTPDPVISDNKSNTWIPLTKWIAGTAATRLFYCQAPTVGAGHTVNANGPVAFMSLELTAWSGSTATPFDQENGATGASVSTLATGSVTPSQNNELVVACLLFDDNSLAAVSINGGFTISDTVPRGSPNYGGSQAYLVQTAATAANPTWNVTNSVTVIRAGIATFKAVAAGAAQVPYNNYYAPIVTQ